MSTLPEAVAAASSYAAAFGIVHVNDGSVEALVRAAEPVFWMDARRYWRALAEATGAEVLTGTHGLDACPEDCMWSGPGNPVVGGVHRHPFAAVMDEQEELR